MDKMDIKIFELHVKGATFEGGGFERINAIQMFL